MTDKGGNKFLGMGCLIVPTGYKYRFVKKLVNLRCLNDESTSWSWDSNDCKFNCKFHKLNNFEIHFKDIDNSTSDAKIRIYKKWIDFIINHNRHMNDKNKLLYFNILYLNLSKLDFDVFGVNKDTTNIYNRFFRTLISSARSLYFKDIDFTINEVFHDVADEKESHDYFYWHSLDFLKEHERINVKTNAIKFIDSDHKNHKNVEDKSNANLIQVVDLLLGCSNQILFNPSDNKNKNKVAGYFFPLFNELWEKPYDYNNHFNYFKSQQVQIFPKTSIKSQKDFEGKLNYPNQFHRNIEISNFEKLIENTTLDQWFG